MLWHRNNMILKRLGYMAIYNALCYIMYSDMYESFKRLRPYQFKRVIYEDHVELSFGATTGIIIKRNEKPSNLIRYMMCNRDVKTHELVNICTDLAKDGYDDLLREVHEAKCVCGFKCFLTLNMACWAARCGRMECVRYLCDKGEHWMNMNMIAKDAIYSGNIECVGYLITKYRLVYNLSEYMICAAKYGKNAMVMYLWSLTRDKRIITKELLIALAERRNHKMLKQMQSFGEMVLDKDILDAAAIGGCEICFEFVNVFHSVNYDVRTMELCATYGNLECLKIMEHQTEAWPKTVAEYAAMNGHFECLEYILVSGAYWSSKTCVAAARNGHLDCLELLHKMGCDCDDDDICGVAANNGHFHILKYAVENGFPYSRNIRSEDDKCKEYIRTVMLL